MTTLDSRVSRRTVAKGAAWSVPAIAVASAAPARAASSSSSMGADYGLFVSATDNGGNVGYAAGTAVNTSATTPEASFSNPQTSTNNSGSIQVQGAGVFTPVTNSGSGTDGSYNGNSGFWWSVPTTNPGTGTGYIPGSTATLQSGAVFTTTVTFTFPSGQSAGAQYVQINGQTWNGTQSGSLVDTPSTSATYLQTSQVAGNWSASAPTITSNSDGSTTFTGTITFTTTESAMITQSGTYDYGQAIIMPAQVTVTGASHPTVTLTSLATSATISYTVPSGTAPADTVLTNALIQTASVS